MAKRQVDVAKELERGLGPEYILFKNTGYSEEPYIEGWTAVQMANRIFGHDGWSSKILLVEIISTEEFPEGKVTVAAKAHARITLKGGAFREDIGFGIAEKIKGQGKAIKMAYKSATTDAIKRALKQFGKSLGSCCNDKAYIRHIRKTKKIEHSIDSNTLIRPGSMPLYTLQEEAPREKTQEKKNFTRKANPFSLESEGASKEAHISAKEQDRIKPEKHKGRHSTGKEAQARRLSHPINQLREEERSFYKDLPPIDDFMSSD